MSSLNAQMVANKVIQAVRKGEKISVSKIMREQGYSKHMAKQPNRVVQSKSYQQAIAPVVEQLEKERQRIIKAMASKDLSDEKYATLVTAMDVVTKNTQLLGGRATDNVAIKVEISEHIANKYKDRANEATNASSDSVENGSTKP
jgi:hypothetical protein